ncbi:hypothetical protein Tco_0001306 [Tanacetum coccineum]
MAESSLPILRNTTIHSHLPCLSNIPISLTGNGHSFRMRQVIDDWICEWHKDVPWVDEKPWTNAGVWTKPTPDNEELCKVHGLPVCNIRRYMMIKYSFNNDEEYVAIKEDEYDDPTNTREEACRAYQEIFQKIDEGWMVTKTELPKTGWFSLAMFLESKVASPRGYGSCPCLDADFLVADSKFMKVAFGDGFKMLLFNPLLVTTSRYVVPTGRVKVPAGRYVVPTGKDNVIVSAGSTKVIPAGRTILVLDMTTNFGKLDKFEGHDFKWWYKKMHFLLTNLKVVYVLTTPMPELLEDDRVETIRRRAKWENELWDSFESKHMAEDASSKKFLVSNFNNYKMVNSRLVMEQFNELLRILGQYTQHGLKMDEFICVSSVIDKLPPSWKDFKHTLKHGKDDLSLV